MGRFVSELDARTERHPLGIVLRSSYKGISNRYVPPERAGESQS